MALELISVHFPKAAGTTLASALAAHYGDQLSLDYRHAPLQVDRAAQTGLSLAGHIRAVHGHFRGDAYTGAPRVTFLREPVANLLSIYCFWQSYPPSDSSIHQKFLAENPDVLHFALYTGVANLMSDGYFGGVDMGAFAFIGFHETRRRDLLRFSEQFGIPVDTDLHLNRTERSDGERRAFLSDLRSLASLRFLLRKDIAFYEEQVRRFG